MYTIEIQNLNHRFFGQTVLNAINLRVPTGAIYGFLGANGAGKTTTLRLILGLLQKQEGAITVFGKTFEKNRISILQKVGSLIETPSVYAHLTANENLEVWQKVYQCPKERIQEVLQLVDLSDTGNKKAGNFSLGMKQRLGIAAALLNKPELLILDEPSNGLDPQGIVEMRELLLLLNQQQGITIIISSHILSEIEKLVTHVGIIHKGFMLFEGTLEELHKRQTSTTRVILKASNHPKALSLLPDSAIHGDYIEIPIVSKEDIASMVRLLVQNDIDVYELSATNSDLEASFMNVIQQ